MKGSRTPAFLEAFRATGSITKSAELAGIEKTMHYRRMKRDPQYFEAFQQAIKDFERRRADDAREWENEQVRRAVEGWEEPVIFQGDLCTQMVHHPVTGQFTRVPLTVRKYDGEGLRFLLRGAMPEKYRERFQHQHTGTLGLKFSGQMENLLETYRKLISDEPDADGQTD